jgi:two-component system, sensor histidine kinase and response regulator
MLHHTHDPILVVLSVLIAIFGSYTALDLANSITLARGRVRLAWLTGGSMAMGIGIWSMHFVGMLAFRLPGIRIAYDVPLLILSVLVAMVASAIALFIVSRKNVSDLAFVLGGLLMGAAISGMHYIGIASMRMAATYQWNFLLVVASIGIAVSAAFVALLLAFRFREDLSKRGFLNRGAGGIIMGFAIAGMHYTAMVAMTFYPSHSISLQEEHLLATDGLAIAVIGTTLIILGIAITGSVIDRALSRRQAVAEQVIKILESITDGFYSIDRKWRFIYANTIAKQAIRRFTGTDVSDLEGKTIWQVVPQALGTRFETEYRRAMSEGVPIHVEDYFPSSGIWFESHAYPSPDGLSVYFRDATERKKNEQALRRLVEKLEVEHVLREKFVAALSHDLRNPLCAAKSTAQIILRYPDRAELRERGLHRIMDNIERADKMIQNLLDVNRLQAGQKLPLQVGYCNLRDVVATAIEELALIHGDRFSLKSDPSVSGYWDCEALIRVVENLAGNAIKYGALDSPISISLTKTETEVILSIHNEGIPLSPDEQRQIFEPFQRVKNSIVASKQGWGLGLTIVRGIVEAHGGTVTVKSMAEHGTTFVLNLPMDSRHSSLKAIAC